MGPFSLGEHIPLVLFTCISAVIDFLGASLHRLDATKGLFRMMIPHRKEKIPAGRELFLPWALEKTIIGCLNDRKGGGGRYGEPLLF